MPNNLQATYDSMAQSWATHNETDVWWQPGANIFASNFKANATILDMGCGAGIKTDYFQAKGLNVTGLDFSLGMIETAMQRYPHCRFAQQDLNTVDTYPQIFDGIWLQAVLLHVPKPEAAATLVRLVTRLKPGGYLYVGVKEIGADGKTEEVKSEKIHGNQFTRFFSYYTMFELQQLIQQAGLTLEWSTKTPGRNVMWLEVIARKA
jgi:trans-aconitate methyltransferase